MKKLLFISLLYALPGMSQAAIEFTSKQLDYVDVNALIIDQFTGQLSIKTHPRQGIQIKMTGPKQRISTIRTRFEEGILVLSDIPAQLSRSSQTIIGNGNRVVVRSSGGGHATVEINGRIIHAGSVAELPPAQTRVVIAPSIPVTLKRFSGNAIMDKGVKVVRISDSNGDVTLAEVQDASLNLAGSGSLTVRHASGDLNLTLSGSGSAIVEAGAIDHLQATVDGSGDITILGRAERATLSVNGSGIIEASEVRQQPSVTVHGSGEVIVGNW